MTTKLTSFIALASLFLSVPLQAVDNRKMVELPEMMQQHMKTDMRDHLLAIQKITDLLSKQQYDEASEMAENRLGVSSMGRRHSAEHAQHMGQMMPLEMRALGQAMHRSASQFARITKDAEVEGGLAKAFGALSEVMQRCVACHSAFRIR